MGVFSTYSDDELKQLLLETEAAAKPLATAPKINPAAVPRGMAPKKLVPAQNAAYSGGSSANRDPFPVNPQSVPDDQMAQMLQTGKTFADPAFEQAMQHEDAMRWRSDGRPLVENLIDPNTAVWAAQRVLKQTMAGAVSAINVPSTLASLYGLGSLGAEKVADLVNPVNKPVDGKPPAVHDYGSKSAFEFANEQYMHALEDAGVTPPRNMDEKLANIAGMMIPIPGAPELKGGMSILEGITPMIIGKGNLAPKVAFNFAANLGMDQAAHAFFNHTPTEADGTTGPVDDSSWAGKAATMAGIAVAATMPFWAPAAWAHVAQIKRVPTVVKPIEDITHGGPVGLHTITTSKDLAKAATFNDVDPLKDIAKRAGVTDIDLINSTLDHDTHASAAVKVNNALHTGQMRTSFGNFQTPIPPQALADAYHQLPPQAAQDFDKYLKLGSYVDDIRLRASNGKPKANDRAELVQAQTTRNQLRMQYPQLADWSKGWQQYTENLRKFKASGPYGTYSNRARRVAQFDHPQYVPHVPLNVDPTAPVMTRLSQAAEAEAGGLPGWVQKHDYTTSTLAGLDNQQPAVDTLMQYGRSVLTEQMKNNVRGTYVDQMIKSAINQSGTKLIRKVDGKTASKFAPWATSVTKNGRTSHYLMERWVTQALKLDPYSLSGLPALAANMRRASETAITGVLSPVFPITIGIRDAQAAFSNAAPGWKGPGWSVLAEPAKILGAKAAVGINDLVNSNIGKTVASWGLPGIDPQSMAQLSARMTAAYQNSLYHAIQTVGGANASLLRENVKYKNWGLFNQAMKEAQAKLPAVLPGAYKYAVAPIFHGLFEVMSAVAESPRQNFIRRNIGKHGLADAVVEGRSITGDTMRRGRSYDANGRLIRGDVVDPEYRLLTDNIGRATAAARTLVPWANPTIQGLYRRGQAAAQAPARTLGRAWMVTGLPALATYAWNTFWSKNNPDGHDYVDYQMNHRPTDTQVGEHYIAVPGLPPERGMTLPIPQEDMTLLAPFLTMLHHFGGSSQEMQDAMTQVGMGILDRAGSIAMPPIIQAGAATMGVHAPSNIFPFGDPYNIREDNVGIASENVEAAIRAMFGATGTTAMNLAYDITHGGDPDRVVQDALTDVAARTPVVGGLGGWKDAGSAYFTPIGQSESKKYEQFNKFTQAYDKWFGKNDVNQPNNDSSEPNENGFTDPVTGKDEAIAPEGFAPTPLTRPTNPLYPLIGDMVMTMMYGKTPDGAVPFLNTQRKLGIMSDQARLLKGMRAGNAKAWGDWQKQLDGATDKTVADANAEYQAAYSDYQDKWYKKTTGITPGENPPAEMAKRNVDRLKANADAKARWLETAKFLMQNKIDMTNPFDVTRLYNLTANDQVQLMRIQIKNIQDVEDQMTQLLQSKGYYPPDRKFSFADLDPMANPVQGVTPQQPPAY
jgi:hypothetical protein